MLIDRQFWKESKVLLLHTESKHVQWQEVLAIRELLHTKARIIMPHRWFLTNNYIKLINMNYDIATQFSLMDSSDCQIWFDFFLQGIVKRQVKVIIIPGYISSSKEHIEVIHIQLYRRMLFYFAYTQIFVKKR